MRQGMSNLTLGRRVANRPQQTTLKRSNAIRRPSGGPRRLSLAPSPTDSSSSGDDASGVGPAQRSSIERDLQLPDILRDMVNKRETCAMIGQFLVSHLLGTESFYAGFIHTLVNANKPYFEICCRFIDILQLVNDDGDALDAEIEFGNMELRANHTQPVWRCEVDESEPISPRHTLGPAQRAQFLEYSDEEIEQLFEEEEVVGRARLVEFSRHSVHIVDQPSPPRSVVPGLGHVDDDSS